MVPIWQTKLYFAVLKINLFKSTIFMLELTVLMGILTNASGNMHVIMGTCGQLFKAGLALTLG